MKNIFYNDTKIKEDKKMKRIFTIVTVAVLALTMIGCKKESNRETRQQKIIRIMKSYVEVEDTEYRGTPTTTFRFEDRDTAEEFQEYWLDEGQTVSSVIEWTDSHTYTVEIIEEDFDDVCRELVRALE